jgi:hypothetical protein
MTRNTDYIERIDLDHRKWLSDPILGIISLRIRVIGEVLLVAVFMQLFAYS